MKIIYEKWWDNDTKVFSIINYKKAWKENGNKPRIDFFLKTVEERKTEINVLMCILS